MQLRIAYTLLWDTGQRDTAVASQVAVRLQVSIILALPLAKQLAFKISSRGGGRWTVFLQLHTYRQEQAADGDMMRNELPVNQIWTLRGGGCRQPHPR